MAELSRVDMGNLKDRLCSLQEEALLALAVPAQSHAFPRWFVKATDFPYWINRSGMTASRRSAIASPGDEGEVYAYTFVGRLVWAHLTAGYIGENDEAIDLAVPQVIEYIDRREKMQSAAFPEPVPWLDDFGFTDGTGYAVFPPSPAGTQQVGAEFIWRAEFTLPNLQTYLG